MKKLLFKKSNLIEWKRKAKLDGSQFYTSFALFS